MDKVNTVIFAPIRTDLIERALTTLYLHTPHNFYVIVVDQTIEGLDSNLRDRYPDLVYLRSPKTATHRTGNLGFAKANNLALSLVTTPYATLANDDVEFIDARWWAGAMETFEVVNAATPDRPCLMACPASVRLPDWSVGRPSGDHFDILPYKLDYTTDDYDFLVDREHFVNEHLTLRPGSVIDGVTLYCPVIDMAKFRDVGPLDETYWPGGAEDYDYACRMSLKGYRSVGTTLSWVWHWWSKSIGGDEEALRLRRLLDEPELRMGDHTRVWGKDAAGKNYHDLWGVECRGCGQSRVQTVDNVTAGCPKCGWQFMIPPATRRPL